MGNDFNWTRWGFLAYLLGKLKGVDNRHMQSISAHDLRCDLALSRAAYCGQGHQASWWFCHMGVQTVKSLLTLNQNAYRSINFKINRLKC